MQAAEYIPAVHAGGDGPAVDVDDNDADDLNSVAAVDG